MKKFLLLLVGALIIPISAHAWVYVPSYGDTGWQTFSTSFASGFSGTVGFVVSNEGDQALDAHLLLDNLSKGTNNSFESGLTGYTISGTISAVSTYTAGHGGGSGNVYSPTDGTQMAALYSNGASTSSYVNSLGSLGTNGAILEMESSISLDPNETFSFDWAFIATDYIPFEDFSLVYFKNVAGELVSTIGLGELNPEQAASVPEPTTMLLLGAGLIGIAGYKRKMLS